VQLGNNRPDAAAVKRKLMDFTEPPSYTSIQQERLATAQRLVNDWYPKINILLFD
jgi:hypothetical protein